MPSLPQGTVGDAVGVLLFTFICLLSNMVLIWLLWVHHERLGSKIFGLIWTLHWGGLSLTTSSKKDVALLAYFVQLCVVSSIIQQIYHYEYYVDIMWAQLHYIKANYPNAEVIFKNGNFGFTLVLSNIRYFCYITESTYLLAYTLHIALSIYGVWVRHPRAERIYAVLSKVLPLVLTGISIGLEYIPAVQRSWTVYMFVASTQAVAACALSIVSIAMILWKHVDSKILWFNISIDLVSGRSFSGWRYWTLRRQGNRAEQPQHQGHIHGTLTDQHWLVLRLSVCIIAVSGFIAASVLTHVEAPAEIGLKAQADAPDLSAAYARHSIIGYIYGVLPGLIILIVFGLTRPFRQAMYRTLVLPCQRRKEPGDFTPSQAALMNGRSSGSSSLPSMPPTLKQAQDIESRGSVSKNNSTTTNK